ncbi:MAG: hypothetical protein WKF94_05010 [Solirubrobacteraceae bacterium]
MAYVTAEARQELLDTIAEASGELATALAALGAAYEQLDDDSATALEEALFRPVQVTFGRARMTATAFASRHGLPAPVVGEGKAGLPSRGVKGFVEDAVEAIEQSEAILTELQDSLSPVQVGDAELRAGLADVRTRLDGLPARAEHFVSRFGR